MFYKLVLCSFRKCSYAWLRLALSRLGIVWVIGFAFLLRTSAIQVNLMALGLSSVQPLHSLLHRLATFHTLAWTCPWLAAVGITFVSTLGIVWVNSTSALAYGNVRHSRKQVFALLSPCTIIVSFCSENTYIARCGFAEDWLRLGKAENKFSLCSHLAQSLRVFAGQKFTVR